MLEQRRVEWTTFHNLQKWFDTLENQLLKLGFARAKTAEENKSNRPEEGSVIISVEQRERIINLDESALTLDGTSSKRGGRPPTIFYAKDVSSNGAAPANKSGYSATFIGGSTASGTPLPPHFQMRTMAENEEDGRIHTECFANVKQVRGDWGFGVPTERGPTFACNRKGGMNEEELKKYLVQAILPLYPDACDIPGKRVLIKLDSGPGQMNESMLAELRVRGFYLLPGLPNSTHVTQETDQNYGLFKSVLQKNLEHLTTERSALGERLHIPDMVYLVFGGEKDGIRLENAFERAFNREANLKCWAKVGAVPLTRKCLYHEDVTHFICVNKDGKIDLEADHEINKLIAWEEINKSTCAFLSSHGFGGHHYLTEAPKKKQEEIGVTVPMSKERLEALAKASSAGQHFQATGGEVLNSDEFFISREKKRRDELIVQMKKSKELAGEHEKFQTEHVDALVEIMRDGSRNPLFDTKESVRQSYNIKELKSLCHFRLLGEKSHPKNKNWWTSGLSCDNTWSVIQKGW